MGNAASVLGNKTIYIIGAVVVTIAKPACEYTAKLVIRGTNDAIDKKLDEVCKKLGEINDIQAIQGSRLMLLESELKSDLENIRMLCIEEKNAGASAFAPKYEGEENLLKLEEDVAAIKDALRTTDQSILQIHDVVEKLPEKLEGAVVSKYEEVTKKYSTYLHDEHTQIYEAISKSSRVPKRSVDLPKKAASLPPSPRGENLPLSSDKLTSAFTAPKVKKTVTLGGVGTPVLPLGPVSNVVKQNV